MDAQLQDCLNDLTALRTRIKAHTDPGRNQAIVVRYLDDATVWLDAIITGKAPE